MTHHQLKYKLREVREQARVSGAELDGRLDLPPGTIEKLETGILHPDTVLTSLIAGHLDVDVDEIDPLVRKDDVLTRGAFARVVKTRRLSLAQATQLWDNGMASDQRFRGGIPENVWDNLARAVSEQGKLFE